MSFIKLTKPNGDDVIVNLDNIEGYHPHHRGETQVFFLSGNSHLVQETLEDINSKIKEKQAERAFINNM